MPLYEYECEACGKRFEIIQKFSDPPPGTCRTCGAGPVRRLLSSPAIQFKGTGWYITDYSRKGKPAEGSSDKPAEGGDTGKDASKDAKAPAADSSSSGGSGDSPSKTPAPAATTPKAS